MEIFSLIGFAVTVLILTNHFLHHYWSRRGFKQLSPKFFVGDIGDLFKLKESIAEIYGKLYEKSKAFNAVGLYFTYRPGLLVNDPELIQNVLVKDFSYFTDHGLYVDEEYDPLSGHLFSLGFEKWKHLRAKLSPLFSPGKLKLMFPTFLDCATNLQGHVEKCHRDDQNIIEIRDLFARYTTDVIASVAFGFDNDSINNPDNIFRKMGSKVFTPNLKTGLRALMTFLMPEFNKFIGIRVADKDVEEFMFAMVKETISFRETNNRQRNDFMQMMIKLMKEGTVNEDDSAAEADKQSRLTLNEVVAQAFVFFIAAFETSSSTMALCLYELTKNQKLQRKVQFEMMQVSNKHETVSYELISELKYLECCIDETLRKYPPAPFLIRECTKAYQIPQSELVIEKGTPIIISSFGIHRDPDIYEEPLTFKPERFLESATGGGKATGLFYLPFGDGPKICIGMRMGKMTMKMGLYMLLSKFNFEFAGKIPDKELSFSPKQFVLTLKDDLNLKVSLRKVITPSQ